MHEANARSKRMRNRSFWNSHYHVLSSSLAVAMGLVIGWLDLHTTEVTVTIASLLLAGLLLGNLQPAGVWRRALLLALGLPATAIAGRLLHVRTAEPIRLDPRIALAALAFALIGCYGGVLIRSIVAPPPTRGDRTGRQGARTQ